MVRIVVSCVSPQRLAGDVRVGLPCSLDDGAEAAAIHPFGPELK